MERRRVGETESGIDYETDRERYIERYRWKYTDIILSEEITSLIKSQLISYFIFVTFYLMVLNNLFFE